MMQIQRENGPKNQRSTGRSSAIQREIRFGWNHLPTLNVKHPNDHRAEPAVEGWK